LGVWAWYRASKSGSCLRRSISTRGCAAISVSFPGAKGLMAIWCSASIRSREIVGSSRRFLNFGERVWMVPDSEVHRDRSFEMPSFKAGLFVAPRFVTALRSGECSVIVSNVLHWNSGIHTYTREDEILSVQDAGTSQLRTC
jgi:hypothetical protein